MRRSTKVSMAVGMLLLFAVGRAEDTPSTSSSASPTVPNPQASPTPSSSPTAGAGQVAQCPKGSTPNRPGLANQERPAGSALPAAMNTESGRVLVWDFMSSSTWTLDVCTNSWRAMKPAQEPKAKVRRLVYDAEWGVVIAFTDFAFYKGQVTTGVWTGCAFQEITRFRTSDVTPPPSTSSPQRQARQPILTGTTTSRLSAAPRWRSERKRTT